MLNRFPLIIVDESTDARIAQTLIEKGYDTFSIQKIMPGTDDSDIIQLAIEKDGYILTEDKDFGDKLVFQKLPHKGAMLLRLGGMSIDDKIGLVLKALEDHQMELLNAFAVLSRNKLRIRKNNYDT